MAKFVQQTAEEEEVLFACFGRDALKGKDDKKAYLIEEGQTLEGKIIKIQESNMWKKTFKIKVKGEEKPVIVLPKTDMLDKLGHGNLVTDLIAEEGDLVQITFVEATKTQKGRTFYTFDVAIAKA